MGLPEITIGAPVRDRSWILPQYLKALTELDYPKDKIRFVFVLNDSTDNSSDILLQFMRDHGPEYHSISILIHNVRAPKDARVTMVREKIYKTLADVRNFLLDQIETDYFFSIDTDIIAPPETLKVLVESNKDIVAGVIRNDYILNPHAEYPDIRTNLLVSNGKSFKHYRGFPQNSLFEVDVTGAIYLMSRPVYKSVRYGDDYLGEDIYFCKMAKSLGYSIWANSNIFAQHVMIINQMECKDCVRPCKAAYIQDNKVYPKLKKCPRKRVGN